MAGNPSITLPSGMTEADLLKSIMRQMLDKIESLTVYAVVTTNKSQVDEITVYWHETEAQTIVDVLNNNKGNGFAWVHPLKIHTPGRRS